MFLKAAQGDVISLGIASCQQEFTEGEVLRRHAIAAYDALWNRCDRLFNSPALFRNMFLCRGKVNTVGFIVTVFCAGLPH